jgi:hypothetical protein
MNNNNLVFGTLNGIKTPPRRPSFNSTKVRIQGLTAANEKVIEKYIKFYLSEGFPLNQAKKAARNQFNLNRKNNRKTRKQRRKTN